MIDVELKFHLDRSARTRDHLVVAEVRCVVDGDIVERVEARVQLKEETNCILWSDLMSAGEKARTAALEELRRRMSRHVSRADAIRVDYEAIMTREERG